MNICLECGITFDDDEVRRWEEAHGEKMSGCPKCLGGFTRAERCGKCGEYFPDGSLYDGICRNCLEERIDYDTGLQFMEDMGYINLFMMEVVLDGEMPYRVSDKLAEVLKQQYRREVVNDKIFGTHTFLDSIRQYILDDDGEYGKDTFAKWLRRRENL